ncbi:MAG: sigma-70 family RNA polymerase sigma factor [Roseiflexaceae bacterium]
MTTPLLSSTAVRTQAEFEALVSDIRPELHRYCARMIGSAVDSEDVVQDALAKAYASLPATSITNMRGWLFRIAHNKAIDYLRRSDHQHLEHLDEHALLAEPAPAPDEPELVTVALSVFLKLTPKQRSCVILKDVMRCSLAEISELLDATVPEIKAALHRGRARLRELSKSVTEVVPTVLDAHERELLAGYVACFNARDFDAVRAMLADEVRLDLINRLKLQGVAKVGEYFHRYALADDWRLALGAVEDRPAILVYDPREQSPQPVYFMLLAWEGAQVSIIRDYRYAPYVLREANVVVIEGDRS